MPNAIDINLFTKTNKEKARKELKLPNKKILLTASRLVSWKGIETAIKAMPKILEKEDIEAAALALAPVARAIEGREIRKIVVVPQRIVNVVA